MQIAFSIICTLMVALLSWRLPGFIWRLAAVSVSALLSANIGYLFELAIYPDSELSSWRGIIIDASMTLSFVFGLYIVLIIQVIKMLGMKKAIE